MFKHSGARITLIIIIIIIIIIINIIHLPYPFLTEALLHQLYSLVLFPWFISC